MFDKDPQTLAECHWEVFCVAPYSGLLVFGQLWLGAIYIFLKRWTVVTDPNGTGMFLSYGFLVDDNKHRRRFKLYRAAWGQHFQNDNDRRQKKPIIL